MDIDTLTQLLRKRFFSNFQIEPRRNNLFQLFAPFYHTDGDIMDIFIRINPNEKDFIEICDCGLTLMRLSYEYEIDTPNKENILHKILLENDALLNDGEISIIITNPDLLFAALMNMSQIIAKVMSMKMLQRDNVTSLFYDLVKEYVFSGLKAYSPIEGYNPIEHRSELIVDYAFGIKSSKPLFLFPTKGADRARLAAIAILSFQNSKIPFTSIVVHDDFDNLPSKDRKIIMSAADKQFFDLEDFKKHSNTFFERNMAV